MKLINYKYSEFEYNSQCWEMDRIDLEDVNLIVGKNAAGKTRVLNVIEALSTVILNPNNSLYLSGTFDAVFIDNRRDNSDTYHLEIKIRDRKVIAERLEINGSKRLERNSEGKGTIFNNVTQEFGAFEIPNEELFLKRRDKLQYPFLQELYDWAISLVKFRFTGEVPKNSYLLLNTNLPVNPIDLKNTAQV